MTPTQALTLAREALTELHQRITDHPAYADLTPDEEVDTGGDTAELSCMGRIASEALAALSAAPAGEPVAPIHVEAVGEVIIGCDGPELCWLVEGGVHSLPHGSVLVFADRPITDDSGSGEVYAAPAPAEPAPTWQPIETAPKDGRAVLVSEGRFIYCVEWNEEFDWWAVDDNKLGPFRLRGQAPTHWMPLPAAPKE